MAESQVEATNGLSAVQRVIGVVSGKGGVGKSLIAGLTAAGMQKRGHSVGIMDADITGPSIPKMFGTTGQEMHTVGSSIIPAETKTGIKVMSINQLLPDETDPVIFRGPIIANTVKQFWSDTAWGEVDFLFVDMPPGTGDVPLTVYQSLPIDGVIIVTSPQDLVSMIVAKAVKMAQKMDVPVLGIVENMSYVECPKCGERIHVFGKSKIDEVAQQYNLTVLGRLPIDPEIAAACDSGKAEDVDASMLKDAFELLETIEASGDELSEDE